MAEEKPHEPRVYKIAGCVYSYARPSRPVPETEDGWTFTFKLERIDGTPADPPSFKTTVLAWNPGDTIPISAGRTLQVVRVRDDDGGELPVLVVADLS